MRHTREAVLSTLETARQRPIGNQFSHLFKILEARALLLCSPNHCQSQPSVPQLWTAKEGGCAGGGCTVAGDEAAAGGGH